jgi:hypothetical protein
MICCIIKDELMNSIQSINLIKNDPKMHSEHPYGAEDDRYFDGINLPCSRAEGNLGKL